MICRWSLDALFPASVPSPWPINRLRGLIREARVPLLYMSMSHLEPAFGLLDARRDAHRFDSLFLTTNLPSVTPRPALLNLYEM